MIVREITRDASGVTSGMVLHANIVKRNKGGYKLNGNYSVTEIDGEEVVTREIICDELPDDLPELGVSYEKVVE